jgi:branched-subunit amino acid ABC-type transport system permease component
MQAMTALQNPRIVLAVSAFLLLVAVLIVRPAGLLGKLQVKRV